MAGGVGRLTACDLTVCAAQLQGVPSYPCGLWVLGSGVCCACISAKTHLLDACVALQVYEAV